MTHIIFHPDYLKHDAGTHPETAAWLTSIIDMLDARGIFGKHYIIAPNLPELNRKAYIVVWNNFIRL